MKRSFHHLNKVIREKFLERKTASKLKSTAIGLAGIILSACGRNIDPDETGTSLLPTAFDDVLRGSSAVDSITALVSTLQNKAIFFLMSLFNVCSVLQTRMSG